MLKIKEGESFYINVVEFRGFIHLHQVMKALFDIAYEVRVTLYDEPLSDKALKEIIDRYLDKYNLYISSIPYKTFKTANKYCSKICDGETENTFKIEIYKKELETLYSCYVTNRSVFDKKKWERHEIFLDSTLLKALFNVEVVE